MFTLYNTPSYVVAVIHNNIIISAYITNVLYLLLFALKDLGSSFFIK